MHRRSLIGAMAVFLVMAFLTVTSGRLAAGNELTLDLEIRERAVTLKDITLKVSEGDRVILTWRSDEKADLHLHGYDLHALVKPGEVTTMTFDAVTAGRFPITAHNFGHATLVYLEIHPR